MLTAGGNQYFWAQGAAWFGHQATSPFFLVPSPDQSCCRCEEKTELEEDDKETEVTVDSVHASGAGGAAASLDELRRQNDAIEFNIATKALAVLRFISEHCTRFCVPPYSPMCNSHPRMRRTEKYTLYQTQNPTRTHCPSAAIQRNGRWRSC